MTVPNQDELTASVPMIIGGKRVSARSTFSVINPATGAAFAEVAAGDISHLQAAVAAARNAFPTWSGTADSVRRAGSVLRIATLCSYAFDPKDRPLEAFRGNLVRLRWGRAADAH